MPSTNITKTLRVTINTHTIVAQRDRACSVKCIKFGHKMPGAMNAHTLSRYSARWDRAPLRDRTDHCGAERSRFFEAINFGHEMPGGMNTHRDKETLCNPIFSLLNRMIEMDGLGLKVDPFNKWMTSKGVIGSDTLVHCETAIPENNVYRSQPLVRDRVNAGV